MSTKNVVQVSKKCYHSDVTKIKRMKGGISMNLSEVSILLIFIMLDYLTGVCVAIYEKQVNSAIGRKGIFNKVGIMICIVICRLIDTLQITGFSPILPIVTLFFILNECFSILENLNRLNVPIPEVIISTLKNFQRKNKSDV